MGFMSKFLGEQTSSTTDFIDLSSVDIDPPNTTASTKIHTAEINGQRDLMAVKDAIYDGNIVIADIYYGGDGKQAKHVINELQNVVRDIGGDIAERQSGEVIITPPDIAISRDRLTDE